MHSQSRWKVGGRRVDSWHQRREYRHWHALPLPSQRAFSYHVDNQVGLKEMLINATYVRNKPKFIHDLILHKHADLACLTETWLGKVEGVSMPTRFWDSAPAKIQQPRVQWSTGTTLYSLDRLSNSCWVQNACCWCWVTKTSWDFCWCTTPHPRLPNNLPAGAVCFGLSCGAGIPPTDGVGRLQHPCQTRPCDMRQLRTSWPLRVCLNQLITARGGRGTLRGAGT